MVNMQGRLTNAPTTSLLAYFKKYRGQQLSKEATDLMLKSWTKSYNFFCKIVGMDDIDILLYYCQDQIRIITIIAHLTAMMKNTKHVIK